MQRANAGAAKGNCGNGEVTEKAGEIVARVWDPGLLCVSGVPGGVLAPKDLCLFYLNYTPLTPNRLTSPQM